MKLLATSAMISTETRFCMSGATRAVKCQRSAVGAHGIEHVVGIDDIAERLRHLLAVLIDDMAQADDILVRDAVGDHRRDRMQRIEPAARLVDCLTDEVRREAALEDVTILERIVPLRIRHRAGIEPAIDDFLDAPVNRAFSTNVISSTAGRCRSSPLKLAPATRLELRHASRCKYSRLRRRSTAAAACPRNAPATAPSRCCSRANCRSGLRECLGYPVDLRLSATSRSRKSVVRMYQAFFA